MYYINVLFIYQDVPEVTAQYKQEDMYAGIVDIDTLTSMPGNRLVTVCGYVRKVQITFNNLLIILKIRQLFL